MRLKLFLPFLALIAISSAFISCNKDDEEGSNSNASSVNALMLEDLLLDGMESTITRSAPGLDFPDSVRFLVYFQDNALPQENRTYDIGVALYNEYNQRICTFPLYENIKLTFAKSYKMDDKIQLSKDLTNGTYLLKPICKVSGENDWQDMKLADDFALTITISNREAQLKEAFKDIIKLNSISFDNTIVNQNEEFKVFVSLFSNNTKQSVPVFLAQKNEGEGYRKLVGETWKPNEKGEGDVTISYAPTRVGIQTYYILTPLSDKPITQFSITTKGQTFEYTVDNIADLDEYILEDNSIKGTFIAHNYDDKVFSQDMYVMLGSIDMTDFTLRFDTLFTNPQEYQKVHLSTSSLGEEQVKFSFTNLEYDSYYAITYGVKGEDGKFKDTSGDNMLFLYTTPSEPSDVDGKFIPDLELFAKKRLAKSPAVSFVNGKKAIIIKK